MSPFKAIIFDLDGTLIDSEIFHFHIWNEILSAYGIKLSYSFYMDKFAGVPTPMNAAYLVDEHQLDIPKAALLEKRERLAVEKLATAELNMMPHALEMLEFFYQRKFPMALCTGSPREDVDIIFQRLNLGRFFQTSVTRDDVKHSKPDPEGYNLCVDRLGHEKEKYLVFEDTPNGLRSAKAAGLTCYAIQHNATEHSRLKEADKIFKQLEEAKNFLLSEKLV